MKKSQILAALALAFALGVAAPAVSTYAVVIDTNAQVATDATVALNKAITNAQTAGGYVGNTTNYYLYNELQTAVANVAIDIENAQKSEVAGLNSTIDSQIGGTATNKTYTAAMNAINAVIAENYAIAFGGNEYSTARKDQAQQIVTNLQGAVAAVEARINATIDAKADVLANYIDNIDTDYTRGDKTYDQVVADAKALPKYNAYANLFAAVAEGNKVLGSDRYTVAQANAATTAINNAIAAVKGESAPVNSFQVLVSGDVIVSGNFPAGVKLSVKPTSTPIFGNKKVTAYSIEVLNADNSVYKVSENITVSIKLPAGYDAAKSGIYFVEGNQATGYKATFNNGYLSFTTNHLSDWAVVEDTVNNPNTDVNGGNNGGNTGEGADKGGSTAGTPNDGALAKAQGSASSTVSIMAAIATALTAAGAAFIAIRRKLAAKKEA